MILKKNEKKFRTLIGTNIPINYDFYLLIQQLNRENCLTIKNRCTDVYHTL